MNKITDKIILIFIFTVILVSISSLSFAKEYGVYERVIEKAAGSISDIAGAIETAASNSGMQVLAKFDVSSPDGCNYKSKVIVLNSPDYARQILSANKKTGPFAVPIRINIFEDESGMNVSMVNPHSINRTILLDDKKYEALSESILQDVRKIITKAVQGKVVNKQYGQMRSKGYIGRTMGVMAGGPFDSKVLAIHIVQGDLKSTSETVKNGLSKVPGAKWGIKLVYSLDFSDKGVIILGVTGTPMDSRSFKIVKAGADSSRKKYLCPGIAHGAAFPVEVVVAQEGNDVKIYLIDAMYRMKIYFEDAGMWSFAKNMTMPGSIQKEITKMVKASFVNK